MHRPATVLDLADAAVVVTAPPESRQRLTAILNDAGLNVVEAGAQATPAADAAVVLADPSDPAGEREIGTLSTELKGAPLTVVIPEAASRIQRRAIDLGACGIVLEAEVERTLVATLAGTLAGQVVVPGRLRQRFGTPPLSYREKQVLALVVRGYTNGAIARELYLSESTVKSHLSSCFEKLGVRSRHEAASVAMDPESGLGLMLRSLLVDERAEVAAA